MCVPEAYAGGEEDGLVGRQLLNDIVDVGIREARHGVGLVGGV